MKGKATIYSLVCPVCKKTYETTNKSKKYCSVECYQSTRRKASKREYPCFCVMCGRGFSADDPDYLFCSDDCRRRRGSPSMFRKP